MNLIKLCFLSLLSMVLTSCGGEGSGLPSQGGGETAPTIVSLQVTPAIATVPVGFELQYLALATLNDGSVMDVTTNPVVHWRTSDPAIATIDDTGLATGLAPGEVIVIASGTAHDVPFERKVTLTVTNPVVTALQVTPAAASIPAGFEQAFTAIATFSDGSALDVTRQGALAWSSSDATVATIDASKGKQGQATGVAPGTVTITASGTANGTRFSATAQLDVTNAVVTALQVTPAAASIPAGFEQAFTAIATFSDGSALDVTRQGALAWSSSDATVATIDASKGKQGQATGVSPGTVTITASGTANGTLFSATAQLDVTNAVVTALQVTPATASIPAGFEQAFTAIATFSDGSALDVTRQGELAWSSSDATVATIDASKGKQGQATGVAPGTVTITASGTANGTRFSATAQLEVTNAQLTDIAITPETAAVAEGGTQAFVATGTFSDASSVNITNSAIWNSDNLDTATINTDGVATAVAKGSTNISASKDGITSNIATLNVTAAPVLTGVSVNNYFFAIDEGFPSTGFTDAKFTLNLSGGAASDYYWSSSAAWAQVDSSGNVSFISQGDISPVTITATPTAGGTPLTYTFTVTSWFIFDHSTFMTWDNASSWCFANGWRQPTVAETTQGTNVRGVGSLFSEWGPIESYIPSIIGFMDDHFWTSEVFTTTTPGSHHYFIGLNRGFAGGSIDDNSSIAGVYGMCRQPF
ncbi:MAG: Ig-like domain-containing protein [Aeromonas sp.]